jgi:hypothetical protein
LVDKVGIKGGIKMKLSLRALEILSRCEEILTEKEVQKLNDNYKIFKDSVKKRLDNSDRKC